MSDPAGTVPAAPLLDRLPPAVLIAIVGVLFGFNWPAVKISLEAIPPWSLRALGLTLAAVSLVIVNAAQGHSLRVPRRQLAPLLVAGFLNIAAFNVLLAFAQLVTPASRAVIVTFTMPLWAVFFARLALGERLNATRATALSLGLVGLVILAAPLVHAGGPDAGVYLSLLAAISWAAGTVFLKRVALPLPAATLASWQLMMAAAMTIVGALVFEGWSDFEPMTVRVALAFAYHVFLAQAVAYLVWFSVIGRVPAGTSTLGTLLVPVVGILASVTILGERPSAFDISGFALIFIAAMVVLVPGRLVPAAIGRRLRPGE